jgi:hypothetical protein
MGIDMDEQMLDAVLRFLDNGDDLPDGTNAKRRWELQKGLFKHLYSGQGKIGERLDSLQIGVDHLTTTLGRIDEKLAESPTVLFWVKNHLPQTGAIILTYSVFMLTLWFILHIIAHQPGFEQWLHLWLHIPEIPV